MCPRGTVTRRAFETEREKKKHIYIRPCNSFPRAGCRSKLQIQRDIRGDKEIARACFIRIQSARARVLEYIYIMKNESRKRACCTMQLYIFRFVFTVRGGDVTAEVECSFLLGSLCNITSFLLV